MRLNATSIEATLINRIESGWMDTNATISTDVKSGVMDGMMVKETNQTIKILIIYSVAMTGE